MKKVTKWESYEDAKKRIEAEQAKKKEKMTLKIKNNDFLLGLDMSDATKEQKIQWLCQIIDNECEKPLDERDTSLLSECADYLRELSDPQAEPTPEQKQRILQKIKARHQR